MTQSQSQPSVFLPGLARDRERDLETPQLEEMASPDQGRQPGPPRDSRERTMDLYHADALSSGPTYNPAPILALHDFLDQKVPAYSYTHTSRGMGTLMEEDEEEYEDEDDKIVISPMDSNSQQHSQDSSSATQQETMGRYLDMAPPQGLEQPPRTPPQLTSRSKSSPADLPRLSPPRRPNWQTIRYQTMPGRTDKDKLAAWIGGWSDDIEQLGDETYCACADSTASPADADALPTLKIKKKKSFMNPTAGAKRNRKNYRVMVEDDSNNTRSSTGKEPREDTLTTPTTPEADRPKKRVDFAVCQNCARHPSPAIAPDADFVMSSGTNRVVLRCKVVWRSIFGGRQQKPVLDQSTKKQWEEQSAGDDGGNEEEDVDIDALSRSSKGFRRPGEDIAERQARLRRAQKLLKGNAAAGGRKEGGRSL